VSERTFEQLTTTLKEPERKDLLERLSKNSTISMIPLYERPSATPKKAEDEYAKLPFLLRIWYAIIAFIFGKSPVKSYKSNMIAKIGREMNANWPGYYNCTHGLLLSGMQQALISLKNAVRIFYNALDSSVNRDRGAFYAFMASFEMPEIHQSFSKISDPVQFAQSYPGLTPEVLKQMAMETYLENLTVITDSQREKMYQNVRTLICLKELSSFLYDRLITGFQFDAAMNGAACSANLVKGQLIALNNILFSLKEVPSPALLSTLFIFSLREKFDSKDEKVNQELQKLMVQTEKSLAVIRNFNKQTPLTLILRCIMRDPSYEPVEMPGGEDWFFILRNYWKKMIEENYSSYFVQVKRNEIDKTFERFFGGADVVRIENTPTDDSGIVLDNALLFSFLLTFYKRIFLTEMNQVLRPILIDGEFIKKENRLDFTESYNELIKMEDGINVLVKKTAPGGDYSNRYQQLNIDVVSPVTRRRKMQVLEDEIETESNEIARKSKSALELMNLVIHGILFPVEGSNYASLANLSTMLGKANREFLAELKETSEKMTLATDLVDNIMSLKSR
jgi:hypothetical protein